MAGNGEVRIKRELEDPLDISIPVAPKTLRKDEGPVRVKTIVHMANPTPDYFMLNKPPPIPFNLPKDVQRSKPADLGSGETPEVALKKLETEAKTLKEEVAALKWLAKRKEQEWNRIIELLKKKEETWLKVKRQAELAMTDKGFQKAKRVVQPNSVGSPRMPSPPPPIQLIRPQQPQSIIKTIDTPPGFQGQGTRKVLVPVTKSISSAALQSLSSQGLLKSGGMTADGKRIIVVKKVTPSTVGQGGQLRIISNGQFMPGTSGSPTVVMASSLSGPKVVASTVSGTKKAPFCQECKVKPSKFECSGCSKIWYCSKECQEKNWDTHETACGKTSSTPIIKQEIMD